MKRLILGLFALFFSHLANAQLISAPYNVFGFPAGSKIKVAVVLLDFTDAVSVGSPEIAMSLVMAENSALRHHLRGISFNHLDVEPDANRDGQPDIYRIQIARSRSEPCDSAFYSSEIRRHISQNYTIPLVHDKYITYLPRELSAVCGSAGFGAGSSAFIMNTTSRTTNHEFGHTLGSSHALIDSNNDGVTDIEYGDPTCVMGRHYESLGATNLLKSNVLNSSNGLLKQYNNESFIDLRGMYAPFQEGGTRALKVGIPLFDDWQSNDYVVVFRTLEGIDARLPTDQYRVQISRFRQKPYFREVVTTASAYIKSLGVGEVFDDPKTGTRIKFVSMSADMKSARIVVERYQAGTCVPAGLTMSQISVSSFGAIGVPQYFQASLTSNDNSVCNARVIRMTSQSDSGLAVSLSTPSLSLAPGSSAAVIGTVTLSAAGSFQFSITGSDSSSSVTQSAQIAVDAVAPTIPGSPSVVSVSRKGALALQWSGSSDAESGMNYYELLVSINGSAASVVGTSVSPSISFSPSVSGRYEFTVRAVDRAGNKSLPSQGLVRDIAVSSKGRR